MFRDCPRVVEEGDVPVEGCLWVLRHVDVLVVRECVEGHPPLRAVAVEVNHKLQPLVLVQELAPCAVVGAISAELAAARAPACDASTCDASTCSVFLERLVEAPWVGTDDLRTRRCVRVKLRQQRREQHKVLGSFHRGKHAALLVAKLEGEECFVRRDGIHHQRARVGGVPGVGAALRHGEPEHKFSTRSVGEAVEVVELRPADAELRGALAALLARGGRVGHVQGVA